MSERNPINPDKKMIIIILIIKIMMITMRERTETIRVKLIL